MKLKEREEKVRFLCIKKMFAKILPAKTNLARFWITYFSIHRKHTFRINVFYVSGDSYEPPDDQCTYMPVDFVINHDLKITNLQKVFISCLNGMFLGILNSRITEYKKQGTNK